MTEVVVLKESFDISSSINGNKAACFQGKLGPFLDVFVATEAGFLKAI